MRTDIHGAGRFAPRPTPDLTARGRRTPGLTTSKDPAPASDSCPPGSLPRHGTGSDRRVLIRDPPWKSPFRERQKGDRPGPKDQSPKVPRPATAAGSALNRHPRALIGGLESCAHCWPNRRGRGLYCDWPGRVRQSPLRRPAGLRTGAGPSSGSWGAVRLGLAGSAPSSGDPLAPGKLVVQCGQPRRAKNPAVCPSGFCLMRHFKHAASTAQIVP